MPDPIRRTLLGLAWLVSQAIATPAGATGAEVAALLERSGTPDLAGSWREAMALERRGRAREGERPDQAVDLYLDAAALFEQVARGRPDLAHGWWRGARSTWLAGDTLPLDAVERRGELFARAEELSGRGLEVDPECAECMLWRFASMGRLRTTRGLWTSVRQLPEMAELLDRGIALRPTYADSETNSTLGNLHYSSAIFYRIFPDWVWIGWLVGVRGDKDRALTHSRAALALHPTRLDYQIELGVQLLCLGTARGDAARVAEGRAVLASALQRPAETLDDARDLEAARLMLELPEKSCGYSGDAWVEIDRDQVRQAAGAEGS